MGDPVKRFALGARVREELLRAFEETVATHDASASRLSAAITRVARLTSNVVLLRVDREGFDSLALQEAAQAVSSEPPRARAERVLERLTRDEKLEWDSEGPIVLPLAERERLKNKLHRLWEQRLGRFDDEPDPDEYAAAVTAELARIGSKHRALAVRCAAREFADPSGANVAWSFDDLLRRRGLARHDQILEFAEKHLEIEWKDGSKPRTTRASAAAAEPRPYSPTARYSPGDQVEHARFGTGTVVAVEPHRVRISFTDGERTLALTKAGP
jgi:hypothetical protein